LNKNAIKIPVAEIGGKKFILLSKISKTWFIRAYNISNPQRAPEAQNHRIKQVKAEKSVKCYSTRAYDLTGYKD
jgi:hypothetical protein